MIYPSPNAKRVQIGSRYTEPMVRSKGKYVLAPRLTRPKPMARTVTRRMRFMRSLWFVLDAARTEFRLWLAARAMPGDTTAENIAGAVVALCVLGVVGVWHAVA